MKPAAAIFWAGNPSLMSFLALYFSYIWTESGAALVRYGQKKTRSKAGFFTVFVYSFKDSSISQAMTAASNVMTKNSVINCHTYLYQWNFASVHVYDLHRCQ